MEKKKISSVRSKDLLLACLTEKSGGLAKLTDVPTAPVVKNAFRWLEAQNCADQAEALRVFARDNWSIEINPGRGRSAPEAGDERLYRVQVVQDAPFIRLPMSSLGLSRGDTVKVTFEDKQILVIPAK